MLLGLVCPMVSHASVPGEGEEAYRRALSLNERGLSSEALPLLADLAKQHPDILRYRFDYAAVASASGEHALTLSIIDESLAAQAPRYVLDALFRSAIAVSNAARAESLHALMTRRFGGEVALDARLCNLYLQVGRHDEALALSASLLGRYPQRRDVLDLRAYTLRQTGHPGESLLVYMEIQRRFPEDAEAPKAIGMILADLGAPRLAMRSAALPGVRLATNELLRLSKDEGAQHVRWSVGDANTPEERFRNADLAIADLDRAKALALSSGAASEMLTVIRGDLIAAYHGRQRWHDAIDEYGRLVADGSAISREVHLMAAASYASVARYPEAEAVLRELAATSPDSVEILTAWIYALSDLERFDEAQQVCAKLLSMLARTDLNTPAKASAYTSTRLLQAMLFAYRNRYEEASVLLAKLQAEAPGFLDATESAGILAGWRGHPRRAEEEFRMLLGEQPERVESRLALAGSRLDRGDPQALRQVLDDLGTDYPDTRSVREARRRLELHDGYYVVANASLGDDREDAVEGNRSREFDLKVYGQPFGDDRWRAFGRYRDLWSGPVIDTTANNVSAGLRYALTDWSSEIELGMDNYARLETAYAFSDQWSSSLTLEKNTFFRQARAVESGVMADVVNINLRWRRDERFEIGGGYRFTDFANNQRSETYLTATHSLYADYDRRLSLGGRLAGQRNTHPEVAYFSPSQQVEASGTLAFEFRQWQDVATKKSSLWHRAWLTAGEVYQETYGTLAMTSFGYGQEIALSDALRVRWSIARTRYPFDGVKSSYDTLNIGFEGYF